MAIALSVCLFMTGLALDGGRLYWEHRQARNGADHAALAAAWAFCDGDSGTSPGQAGEDAAEANGFGDGTTVISGSNGTYTATVTSNIEATVAAVMGFNTLSAEGRATARCEATSGGGFAIFAYGDNCDKQIEFSGSTNVITGKMHSNGTIHISGSGNTFDGHVTYVDIPLENENADDVNSFTPDHSPGPWQDWPLTFDLQYYKDQATASTTDNLYYKAGDMNWDYVTDRAPGLFYATGKIDLGGSDAALEVTLVSEQNAVIVNGSNIHLTPFMPDNLLAFSGVSYTNLADRCAKEGVEVTGGDNTWEGFIYAPESRIKMAGSTNNTLLGSLIGWSIYLSGQTLNNTAEVTTDPGPPVLELIE